MQTAEPLKCADIPSLVPARILSIVLQLTTLLFRSGIRSLIDRNNNYGDFFRKLSSLASVAFIMDAIFSCFLLRFNADSELVIHSPHQVYLADNFPNSETLPSGSPNWLGSMKRLHVSINCSQ